jgi:hypothetical protein
MLMDLARPAYELVSDMFHKTRLVLYLQVQVD